MSSRNNSAPEHRFAKLYNSQKKMSPQSFGEFIGSYLEGKFGTEIIFTQSRGTAVNLSKAEILDSNGSILHNQLNQ
jgi:hypothetical protein